MSVDTIYRMKITVAMVMFFAGFAMMIITKAMLKMNISKDKQLFRRIFKFGKILIKLSLLLIMWAVISLLLNY